MVGVSTDLVRRLELDVIGHLDFEPTLPCEAAAEDGCEYGNDANYIVESLPCPSCGDVSNHRFPCCHACWVDMTQRGELWCRICDTWDDSGMSIRIVEVLR